MQRTLFFLEGEKKKNLLAPTYKNLLEIKKIKNKKWLKKKKNESTEMYNGCCIRNLR